MAISFFRNLLRGGRKYPIKRDEFGRSARQRAFWLFDTGMRPSAVAPRVGISVRTARRYCADWKKTGADDKRYHFVKKLIKNSSEFSEKTIEILSTGLGMSREEVIERLQKPWGLRQGLLGEWPNYNREIMEGEAESRLRTALFLVHIV